MVRDQYLSTGTKTKVIGALLALIRRVTKNTLVTRGLSTHAVTLLKIITIIYHFQPMRAANSVSSSDYIRV